MNSAHRTLHTPAGAVILSRLLVPMAGFFVLCGCAESDTTGPPGDDEPMVGSIQVTTVTTGSLLDPDGYVLTVDNEERQTIGLNGMITIAGLTPGEHDVRLAGLTSNCQVTGANPQTVSVVAGEAASVSFEIACEFIDLEALGQIAYTHAGVGGFTGEIWVMEANGGNPVPVTDEEYDFGPAWSPDGTKIAFTRGDSFLAGFPADVWVIDGSSLVNLTNDFALEDFGPAWSPDGTRIAFSRAAPFGPADVYVMDADGSNMLQLTDHPANDSWPAWSPDGAKIAFATDRDGNWEVYAMDADGSDPVNLTNESASDDFEPAWSPDGTKIAFSSNRDGNQEIYVMEADGSAPVRLTHDTARDGQATWAPDGAQIAFTTYRDGNAEVYIMEADGSSPVRLTNNTPGNDLLPAFALSP